jgi:hypothetical protein
MGHGQAESGAGRTGSWRVAGRSASRAYFCLKSFVARLGHRLPDRAIVRKMLRPQDVGAQETRLRIEGCFAGASERQNAAAESKNGDEQG